MDDRLTEQEFDSLFASPADSAVSDAVDAAPAPEPDGEPTAQATADAVESAPDVDAQPPVHDAAPVAQPPAAPNWDDESNPYLAQAREFERLRQAAEAARARQAVAQTQAAITDLAEGDLDRQAQIHTLIDRIATPLQQQAQAHEQRATTSEKATTALWIALQAEADAPLLDKVKATMAQLMAVEGPDQMERLAFAERNVKQVYSTQLQEKDRRIAELQKQLGAQALLADRQARGADLVDAGRGTGAGSPPSTDGDSFDDFFNGLFAR